MEKLDSFRMNVASMVGALRLMQQHTAAMGVEYAAAVRMRADLGDKFMRLRRDFSSQFLNHYGWNHIHAASALLSKDLRRQLDKLVICARPRLQRMDFCFWSAPPRALQVTIGTFENGLDAQLFGAPCRSLLAERQIPLYTENVLLCAMWARNVTVSEMWDSTRSGSSPYRKCMDTPSVHPGCLATAAFDRRINKTVVAIATARYRHKSWQGRGYSGPKGSV
uniref:Uncharacterized protein n=1 Tax=Haptolina ericina TaxID=156174 RepID=A0A7S3ESW4_9EUKA